MAKGIPSSFQLQQRKGISSHRRWILWLKISLPILALSLLLLALIWPFIKFEQGNNLSLDLSFFSEAGLNRLKGSDVQFSSSDEDDQPYMVTADEVIEGDNQTYHLTNPKADIFMKKGEWAMLVANRGALDDVDGVLNLEGEVELFHDNGYELYTSQMDFDLNRNEAKSDKAVEGQSTLGFFKAQNGFVIEKNGAILRLQGPSEMVILGQ